MRSPSALSASSNAPPWNLGAAGLVASHIFGAVARQKWRGISHARVCPQDMEKALERAPLEKAAGSPVGLPYAGKMPLSHMTCGEKGGGKMPRSAMPWHFEHAEGRFFEARVKKFSA